MERTATLVREKYWSNLLATLGMSGSIAIASIVDRIMVGRLLGGNPLGALSLNSPIICIINVVFAFFIFGGNTLAVTTKAGRDQAGADRAFTVSVGLGTVVMAVLAVAGIIFQHQIAAMLSVNNEELLQPVREYLVPLLFLGILVIPVNGTCAYVRADGMQQLAVIVPTVANVVNLMFDFIFMGVMHLGIVSAGWATNIGYMAGMLCLLPYFRSKKRSFYFTRKGIFDLRTIAETFKIGLSSALVEACMLVQAVTMNIIILSVYGAVGAQVEAVCISAATVAGILYLGTTQTMLPIGGALYGEKDYTGLRSTVKTGFMVTEVFMIVTAVLLGIFDIPFGSIFGVSSPEALKLLEMGFRIYLISFPFVGFQECLRVTLQSTGMENAASVMTGLSGTLCFVPVILILADSFPSLLWLSFSIAPVLAAGGCLLWLFLRRKRTGGRILFPKEEEEVRVFELSIENTITDAKEASVKMFSLCRENGVGERYANYLRIATEELCTNIAKYAYNDSKGSADIFLRICPGELLLRIRDNGVMFNPTEYVDDSGAEITDLGLLEMLPLKMEYNRVLGFNNTIITIGITGEAA